MKTDRELLELAAKAAGYSMWDFLAGEEGNLMNVYTDDGARSIWWPLEDDGDALRLAMKLSVSIDVNGMFVHADCRHRDDDIGYFEENTARNGGCIYAATRRAIVRAAAAIGEAMP